MKKFQPIFLCVLSGMLLWASWPVSPFSFLVFIALVPLLRLCDLIPNRVQFFLYTYVAMLIWNAATTWWICNSTVPGGIAAILANSLLLCLPWMGFYAIKKRSGKRRGLIALAAFWLTFEYIHLNWQLSWPWLTLGNVFASHPNWVQWYEYTGTSGGSCWILLINILCYVWLQKRKPGYPLVQSKWLAVTLLLLLAPLGISYVMKPSGLKVETATRNFVVIQPNIDPYKKFEPGSEEAQLAQLIRLSDSGIDKNTAVVVWPETAINLSSGIDESKLKESNFLRPVWSFLSRHPYCKLFTGIEGFRLFTAENKSPTVKHIRNTALYYDSYNTAGMLDSTGALQLYHKSKLVPGVETLPSYLRFLDTWFEQFGGTSTGYAPQQERTVLTDAKSGFNMAPAICYESIYGEFMTAYMRQGANVIVIITNDGWWANTSGHKQHMQYARLRAIECRRWIVRSANTGISCFIAPDGTVHDPRPWDTAAVLKMNIPKTDYLTFYVRYGDIISRIAIGMAALVLLESIVRLRSSKMVKKNAA